MRNENYHIKLKLMSPEKRKAERDRYKAWIARCEEISKQKKEARTKW